MRFNLKELPVSYAFESREAEPEWRFERALDPHNIGIYKVGNEDIDLFNDMVAEFELPALRLFPSRRDREASAQILNHARAEFGQQGFLTKAALLGSTAAKAYVSIDQYVMAGLLFDNATSLVMGAVDCVRRTDQKHPIRANFPNLTDPIQPKKGKEDFTPQESMVNILRSHNAQLINFMTVAHKLWIRHIQETATETMLAASRDGLGKSVVEERQRRLPIDIHLLVSRDFFDSTY